MWLCAAFQRLSTAHRHDHKHVGPLRSVDLQHSPQNCAWMDPIRSFHMSFSLWERRGKLQQSQGKACAKMKKRQRRGRRKMEGTVCRHSKLFLIKEVHTHRDFKLTSWIIFSEKLQEEIYKTFFMRLTFSNWVTSVHTESVKSHPLWFCFLCGLQTDKMTHWVKSLNWHNDKLPSANIWLKIC